MLSPPDLAQTIVRQSRSWLEATVSRYLPDCQFPPTLAGYPIGPDVRADLANCLHHLQALGDETFLGQPIIDLHRQILLQIDGPSTVNFYSYRVAELLRAYGTFDDNELLAPFTEAQRENIRQAVDSTATWDTLQKGQTAANYWAVLARCEYGRDQLGILPSRDKLDGCLEKVVENLTRNPRLFWDDCIHHSGVYDIYSADIVIFVEPFRHLLPAEVIDPVIEAHVRLAETIAMENSAMVAWGRSVGLLSVCLTLELHAMALHRGLAADPGRSLGLAAKAADDMLGWFGDDGLVTAHRHRMTYGYRGPHRLLQMSLDSIGKALFAARHLLQVEPPAPAAEPLFPPRDTLIPLSDDGAAVWMYRDQRQSFQLPLVNRVAADYVAGPRRPGLYETPVDSTSLFMHSPMLRADGRLYVSAGRPVATHKAPGELRAEYVDFPCTERGQDAWPGRRTVTWRVRGRGYEVEESLQLERLPASLEVQIAEAREPLVLTVDCEQLTNQRVVDVAGMQFYRSFWGELSRLHAITVTPAARVTLRYTVRPAPRVLVTPAAHDYTSALYAPMPADRVQVQGLASRQRCDRERGVIDNAEILTQNWADILHIGWPEHFLTRDEGEDDEAFLAKHAAALAGFERAGLRIIWTMHNRRPHHMDHDLGHRLYRLWAAAARGLIHHSEWGRQTMLAELPYRADAVHAVIPHGHYGEQMPPGRPADQIAADWGLCRCTLRCGVVGRPQAEKQVDLIARAFAATDRDDLGLFVTAVIPDEPLPYDPRIDRRDRTGWLERQEIADQVAVCDLLIIAVTGPTYLTTGQVADAIGAGIPVIAVDWPFLRETLGDGAIYFDGSAADLTRVLQDLTVEQVQAARAAIQAAAPRFAWPRLAEQTLALIDRVAP